MPPNEIHSLTANYHRHMDEVLALHQEALLLQELSDAEQLLILFKELLASHIEVEDQLILPTFEKHCSQGRWSSQLYYKEHKKIETMLDSVFTQFGNLKSMNGRDLRRNILSLLDYEKSFKGVLEHHTEREEQALLPELGEFLSKEQMSKLKSDSEKKWNPINQSQAAELAIFEKKYA